MPDAAHMAPAVDHHAARWSAFGHEAALLERRFLVQKHSEFNTWSVGAHVRKALWFMGLATFHARVQTAHMHAQTSAPVIQSNIAEKEREIQILTVVYVTFSAINSNKNLQEKPFYLGRMGLSLFYQTVPAKGAICRLPTMAVEVQTSTLAQVPGDPCKR